MISNFVKKIKIGSRASAYFYKSLGKKAALDPKNINIGKIGAQTHASVLVVHDKDDRAVSYHSALALKAEWPSIETHITSGLGHRRVEGSRCFK